MIVIFLSYIMISPFYETQTISKRDKKNKYYNTYGISDQGEDYFTKKFQ